VSKLVVHGATLACSMGASPSKLAVAPSRDTSFGTTAPAATVGDTQPSVNLAPFGMCSSPSNPQVAAATAAALGVLTPQPCVPAVAGQWTPGAKTVEVAGVAVLSDACRCACQWGGTIQVQDAGQTQVDVD
jgi:hypothetical protein